MAKNIDNNGDNKQEKVPPIIIKKGTYVPPKSPLNPVAPDEREDKE